jgi:hypothetical protein
MSDLSEYNFKLFHCSGKLNIIADFLSHGPETLWGGRNDNSDVVLLSSDCFAEISKSSAAIHALTLEHDDDYVWLTLPTVFFHSLSFQDKEDFLISFSSLSW